MITLAETASYRACWFPGALYLVLGEAYHGVVGGETQLPSGRHHSPLQARGTMWYCTIPSHVVRTVPLTTVQLQDSPLQASGTFPPAPKGGTFERQEILSPLPA